MELRLSPEQLLDPTRFRFNRARNHKHDVESFSICDSCRFCSLV